MNIGLVYDKGSNIRGSVKGYVDSNYANDLNRKTSLTGYIFISSRGAISWNVIFQSTITLFTIEVRYMTLTKIWNKLYN
jgi:hypothetical protein